MIKTGHLNDNTEETLHTCIKEGFDYKYALEESCIVAITDQKGIIKYANDNFCKISKFSREELIGQDHRIINSNFHPKSFFRDMWVTIANGKIWRGEVKNKAKDGTCYWVDTTIVPFLNEEGKPYQYVAIRADITSRKETEEELRVAHERLLKNESRLAYNESRLKDAQAIAHIGNWEIDIPNGTNIWSEEMYMIYGIDKEEVIPSTELFLSFVHPDDFEYANGKINESMKTFEDSSFDFRFITKRGALRYGFGEWRFEFDKKGNPIRLFGITQDITERKLAEIERTKMLNDLSLRNRDLKQFAYIVSHNLRAPVANILGATNALNDPELSNEEKNILNMGLNESVAKLDNVVKDLNHVLEVKGEITETKQNVRFSELVEDIKISIKNLIDSNSVEIKYDFSEINEFLSIKSYLYSVFFNLISNSIKYRQLQIPIIIEIRSHMSNNKTEIIFTDNGMGIDLQKRGDQVFGLYKRFHTNIEGKGIGLFMVKTQVETLGGKISIKSEVNKGTEFKIEFEG